MGWTRGYRYKAASVTTEFLKSTANVSYGGITYVRPASALTPGQCMHLNSDYSRYEPYGPNTGELRGNPCILAEYEPSSLTDSLTGEEIHATVVFAGEVFSGELTGFSKAFKDGNTNILYF